MTEERRESYRCPIQSGMDTAALRTWRGDVMVRIVEESAGGFTISGDKPRHMKKIKPGQTMSMVAASGCCEVRVVHVTHNDDGVRVGLQRLREMQFLGNGVSGAKVASVAALVVAMFLGGLYIPEKWKPQPTALAKGLWRHPEEPDDAALLDPAELRKQLAIDYLKLDNLQSPQYTRELELTAGQQHEISGIVAETSRALAKLYQQQSQAGNASAEMSTQTEADWSNNGLKLMQASWDRIQAVMTGPQREKLHQIMLRPAVTQQAGT